MFCIPVRAKWVTINGVQFKKEAAVVHSVVDGLPQLAQIENIYVINGSTVVFKCDCFTSSYNNHFHSYILQSLHSQSYYYHHKLALHLPVHIRTPRVTPNDKLCIMPFDISNF